MLTKVRYFTFLTEFDAENTEAHAPPRHTSPFSALCSFVGGGGEGPHKSICRVRLFTVELVLNPLSPPNDAAPTP